MGREVEVSVRFKVDFYMLRSPHFRDLDYASRLILTLLRPLPSTHTHRFGSSSLHFTLTLLLSSLSAGILVVRDFLLI